MSEDQLATRGLDLLTHAGEPYAHAVADPAQLALLLAAAQVLTAAGEASTSPCCFAYAKL